MKIDINWSCCSSQADGQGRIIEFCIMDIKNLMDKLYKELNFEKYASKYSQKKLKNIYDALLQRKRIRNKGCERCGTVYLFQSLDESIESFDIDTRNVMQIDDLIYLVLEDKPTSANEIKQKYELPDWFNRATIPEHPIKNSKGICYPYKLNLDEDETYIYSQEKCDSYRTLKNYLQNKLIDNITREQINQLLSIKISDYDWTKEKHSDDIDILSDSNRLLFKRVN